MIWYIKIMMYKVKILMFMDRINKTIKLYSCNLLRIVILIIVRKEGIIKINPNNRI
jgi:hypothetical protein